MHEVLYHVTAVGRLPSIRQEGLRSGAYFSLRPSLVQYYTEVLEDDGEMSVVLAVGLQDLRPFGLGPDIPGIQEPIMSAVREMHGLRYDFDERWVDWKWHDSD